MMTSCFQSQFWVLPGWVNYSFFLYPFPPSPEKLGFSVFLCSRETEVKTQEQESNEGGENSNRSK